jgi:hypothetical protein
VKSNLGQNKNVDEYRCTGSIRVKSNLDQNKNIDEDQKHFQTTVHPPSIKSSRQGDKAQAEPSAPS